MTETLELNTTQLDCAAYMSTGMTKNMAADKVGVTVRTISRWMKTDAFLAEIERRKKRLIQARDVGDRTEAELNESVRAALILDEVQAIRAAKKQFREMELSLSQRLYHKAIRRLIDLPDEAIAPNLIPSLLQAAIALKSEAFGEWADELGLDAIAEKLNPSG